MRWLKYALLAVAVLILLPIVGLFVLSNHEQRQVTQFYDAHPLLQMVNKVPATLQKERNEVLLQRIAKGSTRTNTLQTLSAEGMICRDARSGQKLLVCEAKNRTPAHLIPRWNIEIQFDDNDRISDGNIVAFKATN